MDGEFTVRRRNRAIRASYAFLGAFPPVAARPEAAAGAAPPPHKHAGWGMFPPSIPLGLGYMHGGLGLRFAHERVRYAPTGSEGIDLHRQAFGMPSSLLTGFSLLPMDSLERCAWTLCNASGIMDMHEHSEHYREWQ